MIAKRSSIAVLFAATVFSYMPVDVDARGFRGGGGHVSRPVSRPSVSRHATRPATRPRTRPSSRPANRPASGWNLDSSIFQENRATNRTPSLADRSSAARSNVATERDAARERAMANPELRPMFEGNDAARRAASRDRMNTAMRAVPANRSPIATARATSRATWGNGVRVSAHTLRRTTFNTTWINNRIQRFPQRWFYWHRPHPARWWWRWATWSAVTAWIVYDWDDEFYYDYGYNPSYENDVIYFNEEPVASYDDYVASAEELANADDPPEDAETEWESLGTWALSTNRDHSESKMMVQLVASADGLVSGTYYHAGNDNTQRIHGSIDKATQRISFTIGDKSTTILETGLANLTKNEAPLWVHFTDKRNTQTWLLARLEEQGEKEE